ncbi:hypothetical protein J437_LFUL008116 [Ladona fulva]|uniref:Uncharacterized protein n=1 Tax=Ladona fulva TaxID=123851 RepID=A0A8K0KHA9_LADFU|nr:hypothetical protein J437_LFUL008116 [Ladona fulva]
MWRMQAETLLIKNDLWQYVTGEKLNPEVIEENAKLLEELEKWRNMDQKARSDLILSINPSELKQFKGCETSREVWLKLESIYALKGPA